MTLVDKPFREKFDVDRLTGRKELDQSGFVSSMPRRTKQMVTPLGGMYAKMLCIPICYEFVKDMLISFKTRDVYLIFHYNMYTLILATLEAFLLGSISDKTAFCLGEWQGMLVNDECSSWHT